MVQKPPLCLGGGGLGVRGWRGACGLGATLFMPGHDRGELRHERRTVGLAPCRGRQQTGGIAPIEVRHAGDTPTECF